MAVFLLIPLLPLLASLILAVGGRRWEERGHRIGIPAIGVAFGLSVFAFVEVIRNGPVSLTLYRFFQSGDLSIDVSLYLDALTVLLLLLVTGVSGIVHVYSSRYMIGDPRYNRFFAVIALFTASMLLLVMSGNLLMLLISWEVMGICSYLLISHAAHRRSAGQAATKAFLVNAIADVGLSFGIVLTFFTFGTLDIQTILTKAEGMQDYTVNAFEWIGLEFQIYPVMLIPFFLFMGAMGKSAQMPFHVWLPFAMEAPTPVSALIHAATMVNAGPFLLVRLSPLFVLSPWAMACIAVIGAVTALFAAVVSLTQTDIKKILAYSTISQIGFMIMACGLGAFAVATFHLLAHGCYKAFFFLSTGNALHSMEPTHHHGQEESLRPRGLWTMYGGALMFACIPPFVIFSGPYEELWTVQNFASAKVAFWTIGLTTIFLTTIYLFRGILSVFQQRLPIALPGSAGSSLIRPFLFSPSHLLRILLGAGIVAGLLVFLWTWLARFLTPVLGQPIPSINEPSTTDGYAWRMMIPLIVAMCGWGFAYLLHMHPRRLSPGQGTFGKTLYVLFFNKLYFDEIYEVYLVQPTLRFSRWLWQNVDLRVIDRAIHGIASSTVFSAHWLWKIVDIRGIDRIVMGIGRQSVGFGHWLWNIVDIRWLEQNLERMGKQAETAGQVLQDAEPRTIQHQLLVMVLWLVLATVLLYVLV